ncbi:MAG: hypothetical protein AYK23_00290 [Candidatus Proteinoplasmatales archaeon SG8-5]|nr:MAG: hypothetical protein AYK23_00290 [Candidatus Proteinoplasmatales archaeon SG8-5]
MKGKRILYGASLLFAILIIIILIYISDYQRFLDNLMLMNILFIVPITLVYTLGWLFRGFRWGGILSTSDRKVGTLTSTKLYLVGNTANLVVPAKLGDMVKVYAVKKLFGIEYHRGLSSVLIDRYFDLIAILILGLVLLPFVINPGLPTWTTGIFLACFILTACVLIMLLFLLRTGNGGNETSSSSWLYKNLSKLWKAMRSMALDRRKMAASFLASLAIWTLECLVTYLFTLALGFDVDVLVIFFAIILANMTKVLPLTPGGIGPYEVAFSAVLVSLTGVGMDVALSIIVLDHVFKNTYTLILGAFAGWSTGINITSIRGEATDVAEKN